MPKKLLTYHVVQDQHNGIWLIVDRRTGLTVISKRSRKEARKECQLLNFAPLEPKL